LPKGFGQNLNDAYDLRQKSDYDPDADFEIEDVEKLVNRAGHFIGTLKTVIAKGQKQVE